MAEHPPVTYQALERDARSRHLQILGGLPSDNDPDVPHGARTVILLGPGEPGFWSHVSASPEFKDAEPDPMDRWSRRVIESWADEMNATALFPFGGPPYQPFIRWAQDSGRCHHSPVGLLVHDVAGLMVSFRGALALREVIDLPRNPPPPCLSCCQKPCLTACPAGALGSHGYDVPGCHGFLETDAGEDCMKRGCAVRRACPVTEGYGRIAAQSAYHMTLFHKPR